MKYTNPYPSSSQAETEWKKRYIQKHVKFFRILELIKMLFLIDSDIFVSSIPTSLVSFIVFTISKIKRKAFILWSLNWNLAYEHLKRPKIYRYFIKLFYKFMIKSCSSLIVPGTYSFNYHKALGINTKKVFVANQCSFDLSVKQIEKPIYDRLTNNEKKTILYLGRITQRKGLDILIRAFKKIESKCYDVRLLVGGDGCFKDFCENLAKKLSINNISFLGSIPFENSVNLYKKADIFVLPSCLKENCEAWGLVINEAMSLGKAIVTTDAVGASFDLVKNGFNGYIVKNGNSTELAEALINILENNNLIKTMGRNSREIFESFNSYDKMFNGFKKAIEYSLKYS